MQLSPQEINEEKARVTGRRYRKYLLRLRLGHVRGFRDQELAFHFPVTALIGTNGGGKSTILGAAALAYKNTTPRTFFPKASIGDDSMADWRFEAEFLDRDRNNDASLQRTARFAQLKWRRDDFPERELLYIEIQRTVPAGEVSRFKRFLRDNPAEIELLDISEATIRYASAVLDRDVSNYKIARIRANPDNVMYVCAREEAGYSQFHFGAGEASIISTIDRIENAGDNSLVLIEEVENGLHPAAVRLFTRYLMHVARRKRLQVIFTTHSQNAIDELPPEGIWACINARVFNGRLTVESLRAVTGNVPGRLVIFVEDEFVQDWLTDALGRFVPGIFESVVVYLGGGYPNIVNVTRFHNENPVIHTPAICLVDGDIYGPHMNRDLPDFACFPGEGIPESTVYEYIYANRINHSAFIRQRCLLTAFDEVRITQEIEAVYRSACDPHVIYQSLGERLNFHSSISLRRGLINIFNEFNPELWQPVVDFVRRWHPEGCLHG